MENRLTKSAILTAMAAAHIEGQGHTWRSLDRVLSAIITNESASLAERMEDDQTHFETSRERSPENVSRNTDRSEDEDEAVLPACVRPDTGSRRP